VSTIIERFTLTPEDCLLLVIDIQERLAAAMSQREQVTNNAQHLLEIARLQHLPIVVTEQYPKGLGPTVPELTDVLKSATRVEKISFSCCGQAGFLDELRRHERNKIIMCGMETHVCVLMTALDLIGKGYIVHVVSDAVSSRRKENWRTALSTMRDAGAVVTSTETVLFQLLQRAGTDEFRSIAKRIR